MKFRKKPVVIEAVQYTGESPENFEEVAEFLGWDRLDTWVDEEKIFPIETLEGTMVVRPYDYIIKGVKGEYYPCKPDIFEETYEAV